MKRIFIGACFLVLWPGLAPHAQESEGQASDVSTEAVEPSDEQARSNQDANAGGQSRSDEIDDIEPGVPSQVLAAEASEPRRREVRGEVMDELDLGATEVTGNQELPKVLYIVPWRKSDPGDLMSKPANTLLDDVLAPIDRSEFVREVDYYRDLFDDTEQP